MPRSPLTPARRVRVDKLATYLEGLPKRYRHFNMGWWLSGASDSAEVDYALNNGGVASCGTSACAAGHGPAAGILVPPRFICSYRSGDKYVDWQEYTSLFVGKDVDCILWCFGGSWDEFDKHHWSAAARLRYLLDNGRPPKGFRYPTREWKGLYAPYRIDAKAPADA